MEVHRPLQTPRWGSAGHPLHPAQTPPDHRVPRHGAAGQTCRRDKGPRLQGREGGGGSVHTRAGWSGVYHSHRSGSKCSINLAIGGWRLRGQDPSSSTPPEGTAQPHLSGDVLSAASACEHREEGGGLHTPQLQPRTEEGDALKDTQLFLRGDAAGTFNRGAPMGERPAEGCGGWGVCTGWRGCQSLQLGAP